MDEPPLPENRRTNMEGLYPWQGIFISTKSFFVDAHLLAPF
jgi:hypothetical protein